MTNKILITLLIFLIVLLNFNQVLAQPEILSETAVLIDAKSGTVLLEKESIKKMYPASLTKIMTAILAIEMGNLTDVITIDNDTPYEIYGSHVALEPGEILTLKDLLYALMLPSANDAATAIAKYYGGSLEEFVELMNKKTVELGANSTHFTNPHGLHDENHYTTAYDLALITKYVMQNEIFKEIVKTTKYQIKPTNKKIENRYFTTLNKLIYDTGVKQIYVDGAYISPYYEGATGAKTGYTPEAGNCLIASANKNGVELIAVTMKGVSLEMYQDAHNLFNYGFNEYKEVTLINPSKFIQNIEIKNGDSKEISAITENGFSVLVKKDAVEKIKGNVIINDIKLPLEKNSVVGMIEYSLDDKILGSINLITPTSVKNTTIGSNNNIAKNLLEFISVLLLILFGLRTYSNARRKINRRKRKRKYKI